MSTFKKMMLIGQDELERMKAKQIKEYDPSLHALARIQDQLDTVLNDPTIAQLPPDERLKLFQKLQHRFNDIKHEGDTPLKLAGVSARVPEPAAAPAALPVPLVSTRYRTHADRLMKHVLRDPSALSVNDRHELVIKGQPISGSNIDDLVSDAFATAKARVAGPRPQGFQEFLTALKDVNAPHSLLMNPVYSASLNPNPFSIPIAPKPIKLIHAAKKTHSHPSSKRPRILKLYTV